MKNSKKHDIPEYDYMKTASTQDCTGLIPAGIVDEEEIDNYEQLYPFLPPSASHKDHKKS